MLWDLLRQAVSEVDAEKAAEERGRESRFVSGERRPNPPPPPGPHFRNCGRVRFLHLALQKAPSKEVWKELVWCAQVERHRLLEQARKSTLWQVLTTYVATRAWSEFGASSKRVWTPAYWPIGTAE